LAVAVGTTLLVAGCAGPRPDAPPTTGTGVRPPTAAATAEPDPSPGPTAPGVPSAGASTETAPTAPTAPTTLPDSAPRTLSVPAIGVDSPLVELGRNPDGTVQVPSLDDPDARPGWYRDSPTPGTLGPAIILGHVDSRRYGPGVFYHLADLRPGDAVDVARDDGTVARFTVDEVRQVAKRGFPTLEVYGNLDHAGLRLITCGGEFDPDAGSYESNIIVFASLIGSRSA
jgi:sortase (surface protein transpeptidase)